MRTPIPTVALAVAAAFSGAAASPPDLMPEGPIRDVRVALNPWGAHLGFELEVPGDDPRLPALIAVIRDAEPGGDHRCANAGAIRFRMRDGRSVAVGLLPGHQSGLYAVRLYDGDDYRGAYRVDRAALLTALGELGVPVDDPAFRE